MPLLRSRMAVHRARFTFVKRFFSIIAIVLFVFLLIVGGHYVLGWW